MSLTHAIHTEAKSSLYKIRAQKLSQLLAIIILDSVFG